LVFHKIALFKQDLKAHGESGYRFEYLSACDFIVKAKADLRE